MGFNPSGKFEGNSGSSKTVSSQTVQSSRALINQIRGTAVANTLNSGIPKHVMRVSASMARASSGTTSAIKVLFHRDPSDTSFTKALVFVRGYQGNSSPVQVASGTASPITVVLNNTGETLSFHVQASGNAGDAPFAGCPTTGATLPLGVGGGFGSSTTTVPPPVQMPAAGMNVAYLPWNIYNRGAGAPLPTSGFTYCQVMYANSIQTFPGSWKVSITVDTALSAPIGELCVIRTLKDSLTTVSVAPVSFGGSFTPTFGTTGTKVSDAISLTIDAAHDYYFCFTGNAFGGTGKLSANNFFIENTSFTGNVNNGGAKLSASWASAVPAFGTAFPLGSGSYFLTGWNVA